MKKFFGYILSFAVVGLVFYVLISQYSFIFSKKVTGVVLKVERVNLNISIMQSTENKINPQLYSYSVAIQDEHGEIFTASSEDRQWAVVDPDRCVEARFYPYPPWNLAKGGTFFNARLDRIYDCSKK